MPPRKNAKPPIETF